MTHPAGWYPDPEGRFEYRYHNGQAWTRDVAVDGRRYVDQPAGTPPPPGQFAPPSPAGAPQPVHARAPRSPRRATSAMIIGIVASMVAWMPLLFVVGVAGGITAIALGASLARHQPPSSTRAFARAGVGTGVLALLLSVVGVWFTMAVYRAVDAYENPAAHETEITRCAIDGGTAVVQGTIRNTEPPGSGNAGYTIRLSIDRADSGRTVASVTIRESGVAPGDERSFDVRRSLTVPDIDCNITGVDGPLPFGFDIG